MRRVRVTEEERDRLEGDKLELAGARHQLEAEYKVKLAPLEQLRRDHAQSCRLGTASAVVRSRMYDQDMLGLENLLRGKIKDMFDILPRYIALRTKETKHFFVD